MKLKTPYIILLLVFVVLGVYYPSIFLPFNSVDDERMVNSLLNNDHFSIRSLFLPGRHGYYYRPLLYATFVADKYLWGLHESFMHLENVILHTINVILVFLIARMVSKVQQPSDSTIAVAAALLFALHPINTEAVNWISGRTDVLAAVFVLLSILLLLKGVAADNQLLCALASGSFFLGCFAKETAVFFLPAVFVITQFHDGLSFFKLSEILAGLRKRFVFHGMFCAACIAYLTVRHFALSRGDSGIAHAAKGVIGDESRFLYTLKVVFKASGFYAKKLFFPFPLNFGIVKVSDWYIAVGILLFIILLYLFTRKNTIAALFITSFSIGTSALLVAISNMAWTPLAERYMYIPCALFSIALVFVTASIFRRYRLEKILFFMAPLLFSASAYATVSRNIVWQSNLTLFEDTVNKSPEFQTAKNDLAAALMANGRKADAFKVIKSMKSVANDTPYNDLVILNRVTLMTNEDKLDEAKDMLVKNLKKERKLYGDYLQKLIYVDQLIMRKTNDKKKIKMLKNEIIEFTIQLQVHTGNPYYYYRIGQLYLFNDNKKDAQKYFAKAYESSPDDSHYKLAAKKLSEKLKQ